MTSIPATNAPQGLRRPVRGAFTLIELMVVVAIIALLVGIMLPSFAGARTSAKVLATQTQFQAITQANESFRADQHIGGTYVPSGTDAAVDLGAASYGYCFNPLNPSQTAQQIQFIGGASLLVYGLVGADSLGSPGFSSLDDDTFWYDDQHNDPTDPAGAYALDDDTREVLRPRYGPYAGEKLVETVTTIQKLKDEGTILADDFPTDGSQDQKVFVDKFGQPILYYRARRGAIRMITRPAPLTAGIFDHRDNYVFTGSTAPGGALSATGVDLGAGTEHQIATTFYPEPDEPNLEQGGTDTFEYFIWDRDVTQRPTPVQRTSFLLISAGPDALYGTTDDVVNWTRK